MEFLGDVAERPGRLRSRRTQREHRRRTVSVKPGTVAAVSRLRT